MAATSNSDAAAPCAIALKEWAWVERRIAEGRQIVLARKGGIFERKAGFRASHARFWIYPTAFHQGLSDVRPDLVDRLDLADAPQAQGDAGTHIELRVLCLADALYRIDDPDRLEQVVPWQALSLDALQKRYRYRDDPVLHVLRFRPYRLPEAVTVEVTEKYRGCKSWLKLDRPLPVTKAKPVHKDTRYLDLSAELNAALGDLAVPLPTSGSV